MTLSNILTIIAIVMSTFTGILLLATPEKDKEGKYFLAGFVFIISLMLLAGMLSVSSIYTQYSLLIKLLNPLNLLLGPLLISYIFIKTRLINVVKIKFWYFHLGPFAVTVTLILISYFYSSNEITEDFSELKSVINFLNDFRIFYLQFLIYSLVGIKEINRYGNQLQNNLANISQINLKWLKILCSGIILLITIDVTFGQLAQNFGDDWVNMHNLTVLLTVLFIILMTMFAIKQPQAQISTLLISAKPKYQNSGLSDNRMDYYLEKLTELIINEKTYLDNQLSLAALANQLDLTPHHLSQILNERLKKSFYDYINELRIEHAKKELMTGSKKIITVAFDSGYNSKASFYNSFKKHVGTTPSAWREQYCDVK